MVPFIWRPESFQSRSRSHYSKNSIKRETAHPWPARGSKFSSKSNNIIQSWKKKILLLVKTGKKKQHHSVSRKSAWDLEKEQPVGYFHIYSLKSLCQTHNCSNLLSVTDATSKRKPGHRGLFSIRIINQRSAKAWHEFFFQLWLSQIPFGVQTDSFFSSFSPHVCPSSFGQE